MGSVIAARAGLVGDPGTYTFRTVDPDAIVGVGQLYWKEVAAGEHELFVRDEDSGIDIVQITDGNALNAGAIDHNSTLNLAVGDVHTQYAPIVGRPGEDLTVQGKVIVATVGPTGARQHTLPDIASDTVALLAATQTLAAKTLTTPDINGGTVDSLTAFSIRSTGAAFDLTLATATVFTAGRALTIDPGDAARTVTLIGNPTLADWFDQSVKTTANPTFVNLTITSFAANWTNAGRTVADLGIVTTVDINGGTIDGVTIGGASAGAITGTTITADDLALSSGAVINFNSGDVTVTHSANTLDFDGITETHFRNDGNQNNFLRVQNGTPGTVSRCGVIAEQDGTSDAVIAIVMTTSTSFGAPAGMDVAGAAEFRCTGANLTQVNIGSQLNVPLAFFVNDIEQARFNGAAFQPGADDRIALGVPGTAFSDLALATGAVIDFGNTDYTATHSAGLLTLSGDLSLANLTITSFAANWTNAGRTIADLGIVTTVDINGGTIDGVTIGASGIDLSSNTLTGTKAEFDTACSDGDFAYSGGAFHDGFSDFVANEHIDWTGASVDLSTTATIHTGAITVDAVTLTAATNDAVDVSDVSHIMIDTSGNNVAFGGTVNAVAGQILHVCVCDATNDTTMEDNEGTGNQDFQMHKGADETLAQEFGGWSFIFNGTIWLDLSHAQHV